ncbi:uncharacterized protein LOC129919872 isoform X2 [Episyrphus balteatus]|uniref:uncharacterized protein LOC129919872 isoform X2 n=1 Tax=Episyrphus balteatus TaxID=286459 RepID=UPI002486C7AE|nr:uncharacterized protein LOC129919872 isoform X2 [Episyrphus balteatus]
MIVLSDSKIEQKKKTSITYVVTINGNKLHIQRVHAWGGKSLWKISLIYCAAGSVKAYNRRAAAAMTNKRRGLVLFLKNCIKSITRTNPHNSCQITLQKTNRLKLKGYT